MYRRHPINVRLGSWTRAIAVRLRAGSGSGSGSPRLESSLRRRWQVTSGGGSREEMTCHQRHNGGVRFGAEKGNKEPSCCTRFGTKSNGVVEGLRQLETTRRQYHSWSPPTGKDEDNSSLNLPVDEEPRAASRDTTHERQEQHQPQSRPKPESGARSAQAVWMEEFAALERKVASPPVRPRQRTGSMTPEQVAMEEFASLERKLNPATDTSASPSAKQNASSRAPSSPLTRPEEPDAEECCGNGCATCVWIGYWEELQAWEEAEREREEAPP